MATKVQSKTYFPGSIMNLNNGFPNGMWDLYHDDRSEKNQRYNSFMMIQAMDGYSGYAKEQMRQTILKQDSIFRHQLEELHRLYQRQRDLMKEHSNCSMPFKDYRSLNSKSFTTQRRVIDLELPADVYEDDEVENVHKLADLNEPIQVEEPPNSGFWYSSKISQIEAEKHKKEQLSYNNGFLQGESTKAVDHLSRKRTLFGVELCERTSQNLDKKLPAWLTSKPNLCNQQTKVKETTTLYQMNLDSLQHNSQQFFKNADMAKNSHEHNPNFKILGVPIVDMVNHSKDSVNATHDQNGMKSSNSRHHIDLNLSFDEEEGPTYPTSKTYIIPEAVVKIASMEIDLEADPPLTMVDSPSDDEDLIKVAAEAIMSMSSSEPPPPPPPDTLLQWFADVIEKKDDKEFIIPEGMDYFEYMTLKIQETKEEYKPYNNSIKEEEDLLPKKTTRKGQGKRGRQKKDFQRDILPGIVSLSRREVTEDIQTFEEAFTGIGVSWQSKRKVAGKNGRGRRRVVDSGQSSSPPPPEESVCQEVEKSLSGWGKRTRRVPRQRCQSGGNYQSLALKC